MTQPLPPLEFMLTEQLYNFCAEGERVVIDDHRPAPSFWHELTQVSTDKTIDAAGRRAGGGR